MKKTNNTPFDRILAVDFETAWGRKIGLGFSNQTNEEYIRDPRFKPWGLCWVDVALDATPWKEGDPVEHHAVWVRGKDIAAWTKTIDWSRTAIVAHNAQFDVTILSWLYGVKPAFIFDTLSMGRALRGVEVGNSLKKLADDYGLPPKGTELESSENYLDELPFNVEMALADYCRHDVWLCEQLFLRLLPGYPVKELKLIDMTLRMYTEPMLELDKEMLSDAIEEERNERTSLLQRLGVDEKVLASNDQFAALLQGLGVDPPTKVSKTTGEKTFALAKNDALFQALLNSDDANVVHLCEARLAVKSTMQRTRAQRFLEISQRGRLPFPLTYFGAVTGRYTAAKGSQINMQNLKRGSFLRKAIMAPEGHLLCVGDLSQIEPRVLAYLADYDFLLNVFKAGGDPYATFGAQMFNIPGMTKDSHPVQRQSAKSALLGCFGSNTPVLTQRGWVTITDVQSEDLLWDGLEWVRHQGLVPQGEKEVLTAFGISATSDHEILTERGWQEWSAVLKSPSLLRSALSLASLPACDGVSIGVTTTRGCVAHADGKVSSSVRTYWQAALHDVIAAQSARLWRRAGKGAGTTPSVQTTRTGIAYWIASVRSSFAALTPLPQPTLTMVGEASPCTPNGWKTAPLSYATLSRSRDGTSRNCNWTASTTTVGMFPAICASLRAARTWLTSGRSLPAMWKFSSGTSQPLKQRMQTYDIAYAGPRNRFTILTDAGPLIVHNCGYQLGWASFAAQLLTGFLGAPPLRYTKGDAKKLGVGAADVERFLAWEDNVKRMMEIPHTCTDEELLVHCLTAKAIIDKYRSTAQPVVALWNMFQELIPHSLYKGNEYKHKCLIFRKEEIVLPSGMSIHYPDLKPEEDAKGRVQWSYFDGKKRIKLYAGKITNNVVQGTARCVMTDGMLRIAQRYPVKGTVHDEAIAVIPEEDKDTALVWMIDKMTQEPAYLPGLPLAADGGVHKRYGLAKN